MFGRREPPTSDENDPIGAPGDRDAVERVGVADELGTRRVHRPETGCPGKDERAVDVEENEFPHVGYGSLSRLVARRSTIAARRDVKMKLSNLPFTAILVAVSGAVMLAQAPAAPASSSKSAAGGAAHADIKGEGITGTAEFVERAQGTGKLVEITVTCERAQARNARRPPARGRQMRARLHRGRRPFRSGPGGQHGS